MTPSKNTDGVRSEAGTFSPPSISLPKGGGAVRGIGEKFAANPVTGTGSITLPITTSPGRSGFGPQLSLSYDSGRGNSEFGFGWTLSLPAITRKTDKGLPQYRDAEESDVFVLSGTEDLVAVFQQNDDGSWTRNAEGNLVIDEVDRDGFTVRRYRPRIEGVFARIERWTRRTDGDTHWRSISCDNILTLYGLDSNARIADPTDPAHVFSWLISESRDDRGNAVVYEYKPEDGAGADLSCVHQRNRGDRDDPRRTSNRHPKRIRYGNGAPLLDSSGFRPTFVTAAEIAKAAWSFEVVFDYGEHDADAPTPRETAEWKYRVDPFSTHRAGFEVRTCRLCQRVLMFHHFPGEPDVGADCLVRSTDLTYSDEQDPTSANNPVYTFLSGVTQSGYRRAGSGYLRASLPSVEYEYTQPIVQDTVRDVDPESLENLPVGLDGTVYGWTDLHGEGISGILTEQTGAWLYKRNISPISSQSVEFAPLERVITKPNVALADGHAQFLDLTGDGQPDVVVLDGPMPGLYEHDDEEGWHPFRPFTSRLNREMRDPNLKFLDLDGDGHVDVLISEDDAFVWYPSLAERGFRAARRVQHAAQDEEGPRLVFADGTQSVYLADLSGDGLTDLVRIRNGEVCYWPSLGYGRFGARITMDHSPWFDEPEQFDQMRVRLADIDGSGTTDIIYLHRDGVQLYFNQSGNSWSSAQPIRAFPSVDDVASVVPVDLLGNGTACLVWSSPMPRDTGRQMRYVDLMGGRKPHLLVKTVNNLGAETRVDYAPSTKFYLRDKYDGRPWVTRLPFPVHVVERVETYDRISGNWFVTRYAYHHGYFDAEEREFRGFGMVEQRDTEEFAVLSADDIQAQTTNLDAASHVPPVLTKTWFHTGSFARDQEISRHLAGEYYGAPQDSAGFATWANDELLDDTVLPEAPLTADEAGEAVRALKGALLRQEVYANDGTGREAIPYTVTEQNFTIRLLQPRDRNRHAVLFTHPREAISYTHERNPGDPRISHSLTMKVDDFGNVLRSLAVGYPRADVLERQPEQNETHVTLTLNRVANCAAQSDWHRVGLPVESRTYEVVKPPTTSGPSNWEEWRALVEALIPQDETEPAAAKIVPYEQWDWREQWDPLIEPGGLANSLLRLIEHVRTLYRPDDMGVTQADDPLTLLPLGTVHQRALTGETYKLAFAPALPGAVYGARVNSAILAGEGRYVHSEGDSNWWVPSGRIFYSQGSGDTAAQELAYAQQHFFLPHRYRDPFHTSTVRTETVVTYDAFNLLVKAVSDPVDNLVTVETADDEGNVAIRNDYRVLQPYWVTDPNGNRTKVAFDALGMVVAIAVMGKPNENLGDLLEGFTADLILSEVQEFVIDPRGQAMSLLGKASARIVYDLKRYQRAGQPPFAATLARETHFQDAGAQSNIQISLSYSDGFGREIQRKLQAEQGDAPQRQADVVLPTGDISPGDLTRDVQGKVVGAQTALRWVGSGRTMFNNKGKPVRKYEPFFSSTHLYERELDMTDTGVSPVLFYDPLERIVATVHPNRMYEKVVFDPWRQRSYDVNDTVAPNSPETGDPRTDPDIGGYVAAYFSMQAGSRETWYQQRISGALGPEEKGAAEKAALHANTPTSVHFDALGRPFLTVVHNRYERNNVVIDEDYLTRVHLDVEGNHRTIKDARDRVVMRYDYDILGKRIHQASMDAGERWTLNDVTGKGIRAWDSRGHELTSEYDQLRRVVRQFVAGTDPVNSDSRTLGSRVLFQKTEYGEGQSGDVALNLRTRTFRVSDASGVVTNVIYNIPPIPNQGYDFKGNLLGTTRELTRDPEKLPDWSGSVPLDLTRQYVSSATYDALNRVLTRTTPDDSVQGLTYNTANLLESVDVSLRGAAAATSFVTNIDYNAKGQRTFIEYKNGAKTTYTYDEDTFRLINLKTTRPSGLNGTAVQLFTKSTIVQDLHYTYDPAGNITTIRDDALQTLQYNNENVEPLSDFTYDAIYRLTLAKGREHIGQTAFDLAPVDDNYRDYPFVGLRVNPNDSKALRNYTETYDYDEVGNIMSMVHTATGLVWRRDYVYQEPSLIEPANMSNRLSQTTGIPESCAYDAHGNTTRLRHLPQSSWDHRDQLLATSKQVVNSGTPESTWYVYGAGGQRVLKVTNNQAGAGKTPTRKAENIYLGDLEIYRTYQADGVTVDLERETLHVVDDTQRIAVVETRTIASGNAVSATPLQRYQLSNHLGSSVLELANDGALISYEEYHPYGTTAFQAWRSLAEVSLKRYRYTGKERDEENALQYFGARYYALWLGRWTSCEPAWGVDGLCSYQYCRSNPLSLRDSIGLQAFPTEAEIADRSRLMTPEEFQLWSYHVYMPERLKEKYVLPAQATLMRHQIEAMKEEIALEKRTEVIGEYHGRLFTGSQYDYGRFKRGVDIEEWRAGLDVLRSSALAAATYGFRTTVMGDTPKDAMNRARLAAMVGAVAAAVAPLAAPPRTLEPLANRRPVAELVITGAASTPRVGPAATIPENPGAFLERGAYGETEGTTYLVRVGPEGRYGDFLFFNAAEAQAYARNLSELEESAIRDPRGLPEVWSNMTKGNPVNEVNVFAVPKGTHYVQGVVGPQTEFGSGKVYSGGGPQVVIDWTVRLHQVGTYPVGRSSP